MKILDVIEVDSVDEKGIKLEVTKWCGGYDGYQIKTDDKDIFLLISNGQGCCESWGYLSSLDKLSDFNGANILDISYTDLNLKSGDIIIDGIRSNNIDINACQFLNINTDKGLLQFVVYNEHNGYYGHDVRIVIGGECVDEGCL